MMNGFLAAERPSKKFFYHLSMFKNILALACEVRSVADSVTVFIDPPAAIFNLSLGSTFIRTEFLFAIAATFAPFPIPSECEFLLALRTLARQWQGNWSRH
jgi:hypothetical protein